MIRHLLKGGVTKHFHDPLQNGFHYLQKLLGTYRQIVSRKTRVYHSIDDPLLAAYFPEAEPFIASSRPEWFLTDAQDFTPNYIAPQSPWTNPAVRALYAAESTLTYAARVKTPTLIMTDAGDQRVPEPLSYAFYHAIRAAGTPVTMVVIPVDGHFPGDPVRIENVFERWVDWFETHL